MLATLCLLFYLYFHCMNAGGGLISNRLKLQHQSVEIQQQIDHNRNDRLLLEQIFSYLTDDELSLLYNSTDCQDKTNPYDITTWQNNQHFVNILTKKQGIVTEECGAMNLTDACYDDCVYYNNVLSWIGVLIDGNTTEMAEIMYMAQLYSMSAGPMAYYDAGNPDMCDYNYGTYCYTPAMAEQWGMQFPIQQHACCLPGSCIGEDAINVLQSNAWCFQGFNAIYNNLTFDGDIKTSVLNICEPMPRKIDHFGPKFVILIFIVFVLIVIVTSIIKQYLMERRGDKIFNIMITSFNIQDIFKSFKSVRPSDKSQYNYLDGIRVWSMSWVVLGHSMVYYLTAGASNAQILMPYEGSRTDYKYAINNFYMTFISYAIYAVDSFFFLSGFLGAFSIYRQISKYPKGKAIKLCYLWIPLSYLTRFLRIAPMMMYITAIQWQLSDQLPGGYHVISRDTMTGFCDKNWYKVLFFYSNIMASPEDNTSLTCMGQLWYIQCDMQFFLLLPWILLLFAYNKLYGLLSSLIPILICIIIRFDRAIRYDYTTSIMAGNAKQEDDYYKPWNRMAPYFVGVALMLIFIMIDEEIKRKKNKFILSKSIYYMFMLLSGFIMSSLVIWPYGDSKNAPNEGWSSAANEIYYALSVAAWGFGLAFLVFALRYRPCENNEKSIIKSFLSLEIYQPIGKLTYLMYLLHLLIFDWWAFDLEQPAYYTEWDELLLVIGVYIITAVLSLILWFFMEKPISNLITAFLKSITTSNNNKKKQNDDNDDELLYKELNKECGANQYASIDGATTSNGHHDKYSNIIYENEQTLKGNSITETLDQ